MHAIVAPSANVQLARVSRAAARETGIRWKILLDGGYVECARLKAEALEIVRSLNLIRAGLGELTEFTRCWCGEWGWPEDLFDDDGLEASCGGSGELNCYCGGDFCVCHHHGEAQCWGCGDCMAEVDDEPPCDDEEDDGPWDYDHDPIDDLEPVPDREEGPLE